MHRWQEDTWDEPVKCSYNDYRNRVCDQNQKDRTIRHTRYICTKDSKNYDYQESSKISDKINIKKYTQYSPSYTLSFTDRSPNPIVNFSTEIP